MANGDAQGTPQAATGMGPALNSSSVRLSSAYRNRLGSYFICLAALTFYLLIATWPVVGDGGANFVDASVFGYQLTATPDARLFITVVAAGALGSLVHCLTSFADYAGNRTLKRSWVWYLILRTPIGIALALLFYLVLRGGLIAPTLSTTPTGPTLKSHAWTLLNPYGLAAIAAMAGMFSKAGDRQAQRAVRYLVQDRQSGRATRSAQSAARHFGRRSGLAYGGRRNRTRDPGPELQQGLRGADQQRNARRQMAKRHPADDNLAAEGCGDRWRPAGRRAQSELRRRRFKPVHGSGASRLGRAEPYGTFCLDRRAPALPRQNGRARHLKFIHSWIHWLEDYAWLERRGETESIAVEWPIRTS